MKKFFFNQPFLLVTFSFLLYSNTLTHQYVIDDAIVITENRFTQKGFSGIMDILTHDTFEGFFKHRNDVIAGGRYRPLSLVTFAIEWELFGKNPFVSHLVNVLLFTFCSWLLFQTMTLFFPFHFEKGSAFGLPFITAILFAVHPIHTEVVANIKGRDEILAMIFSLATLFLSFRYLYTKKIFFLIFSAITFFLALLSKENSITFLGVISLAIYFFRKENFKNQMLVLIPLVLSTLIFLIIRSQFTVPLVHEINEILNNPFVNATAGQKYATIFFAMGKYLLLLIFPFNLTHDYYFNQIPIVDWDNFQVIISLLVYCGLVIFSIVKLKSKNIFSFGFFYLLFTLSIVSNLFFPVGTILSERFLFMPSLSFCLATAFLYQKVYEKYFFPKNIITLCLSLLIVSFSIKTFSRNFDWKDNLTIFSADIKHSPNSTKAHFDLASELTIVASKEQNVIRKEFLLNQAIHELNQAIEIYPDYSLAYLILGNVNFLQHHYQQAITNYRQAIRLDERQLNNARLQYAASWYYLGQEYGKQKNNLDSAVYFFKQSIYYDDANPDSYQDLGIVYAMKNDFSSAISMFNKALELAPHDEKILKNLSIVYYQLGDTVQSNEYLRKSKQK